MKKTESKWFSPILPRVWGFSDTTKKKGVQKWRFFFCPLWGVAIQCSHSGRGRKGEKVKNWNSDRNNGGKHVLMAKNYVNFFSGGFQKKKLEKYFEKKYFWVPYIPKICHNRRNSASSQIGKEYQKHQILEERLH